MFTVTHTFQTAYGETEESSDFDTLEQALSYLEYEAQSLGLTEYTVEDAFTVTDEFGRRIDFYASYDEEEDTLVVEA
jgi:hypothetical protein